MKVLLAVGNACALVLAASVGLAAQSASVARYGVRVDEVWIPMKDGVRLAANLFLPANGQPGEKFPVLLEYLPYRKDDGTALRDYPVHAFFARCGFVGARVDIRGTGRSEGHAPSREYSHQEQQDAEELIAWLARQPWSNGNVGMFGISWGGFNAIQLAMRRPPALKAIIAVCATEQLYNEDIHFIDGMMHVDEYELFVDSDTAISRAPDFPLDEHTLQERFDNPPWLLMYKRHQRDGPFWKEPERGLDSIQVPVFLIGGMLDGYRDSIPRMLEELKVPVKAIIGPWNHSFPHDAVPGPLMDWRELAVRWWDQWLRGRDTGILREPRVAVYMRHWHPPELDIAEIPGEWRQEAGWPPRELRELAMYFHSDHSLGALPPAPAEHNLTYVPSAGIEASGEVMWWGDLTIDQRLSDAYSLVYDSAPLEQDIAVLGRPRALLQASASASMADWFVRISDVAPDGRVTLVTGAGLNGAQRDSMSNPDELESGRVYSLTINLHLTSWVFPRGHRIRVEVSNALWPMIWPTPYAMSTSLKLGGENGSRLLLPVVPLHSSLPVPHLPVPTDHDILTGVHSSGSLWPGNWKAYRDYTRKRARVDWGGDTATDFPWGRQEHHEQLTFTVDDVHPESSSAHGEVYSTFYLKDRVLTWRGVLDVHSDARNFYCHYRRELLRDGKLMRERTWEETFPRDHQ